MSDALPEGWTWAKFGEIADTQLGKMLSKKSKTGVGSRPYLRNQNVQWHRFDLDDVAEMDFTDYETAKYELRPGDLLVCEGGEVGRCAMWTHPAGEMFFQKALHRVRPRSGIHGKWLEYYLRWAAETGRFAAHVSGSTISHLPQRDLRNLDVPVPPRSDQELAIAAIEERLSRLESARRAVLSARRRLEVFQRSAVVSLFDRPDWPWTTLGEIAEVKGGVTKDSKRQADPEFVEVPYLRVANVQRGFLDLSEVSTMRVAPKKAEQLRLVSGDVLFNEGGDRDKLGRGWVWEGQIDDCIHQNHVFRTRLRTADFDPYFVSMHGNTWGQQWFERHGKQTTNLASINLTTLKAFPVPAPPVNEQREMMRELEVLLRSHERLRSEVDRADAHAESLRRAILAATFTGRLSSVEAEPSSPADESTAGGEKELARGLHER